MEAAVEVVDEGQVVLPEGISGGQDVTQQDRKLSFNSSLTSSRESMHPLLKQDQCVARVAVVAAVVAADQVVPRRKTSQKLR